ncbi:hypothetical protein MSIBF_A650007 [groundwater metagenome]|uniref:Glutamine amidotransferase type-2 domain-containing protein n=1 Tax=groundwater metagenome TaxID=717931 RepID=A0A098EEF5_9ZZZZ
MDMADTLKHRGPDDEGFYFAENVSLGHRRLTGCKKTKILDLVYIITIYTHKLHI